MAQTDQTICADCKRHGQDADKRNVLHRDWWMAYKQQVATKQLETVSFWRSAIAERDEQISRRDVRITELKSVVMGDYDKSALGELHSWLESAVVQQAENRMRGAYRSRDRVMGALWKLDQLHGAGKKPGICACSKPGAQCKERAALDPIVKMLDSWEAKQINFVRKDLEHHLPPEHPEVQKRRRNGWAA